MRSRRCRRRRSRSRPRLARVPICDIELRLAPPVEPCNPISVPVLLPSTQYGSRASFEQSLVYACEHCGKPKRAIVRGYGFGYATVPLDIDGGNVGGRRRAAHGASSSAQSQLQWVLALTKCPRCSRPSLWAEEKANEDAARAKTRYRLMAWVPLLTGAVVVFMASMSNLSTSGDPGSPSTLATIGLAASIVAFATLVIPHGGTPAITAEVLFFPDEGDDQSAGQVRAELAVRPGYGSAYGAAALGFLAVILLCVALVLAIRP